MKFRDIYEGKQIQESPESIVASYKMRAKIQMDRLLALVNNSKSEFDAKHISRQIEDMADALDVDTYYRNQEVNAEKVPMPSTMAEGDMKFQALGMAKQLHNKLAGLTFIDMLSVMSADNPAKKEVQDLETAINALTTEVGDFIQKYIPDVADADVGDTEEYAEPEEPEEVEEPEEPKEPKDAKPATTDKAKNKKIKDNEEEIKESLDDLTEANKSWKKIRSYILGQEADVYTNDSGYTFGKVDGKWVMVDFDDEVIHTGKSAAEMKRYFNSNLTEGSPVQDFKTLMYKTMYGKEYEMAIKVMKDENISAADAAKRFRHVDARALAELFKKY
jgi:hypothetical protein